MGRVAFAGFVAVGRLVGAVVGTRVGDVVGDGSGAMPGMNIVGNGVGPG